MTMTCGRIQSCLIVVGTLWGVTGAADDAATPPAGDSPTAAVPEVDPMPGSEGYYNLAMPTLGGRQFWGDLAHFRGWRIQENVYTHHCRLIDPNDVRHAWGTHEQCLTTLQRLKTERQLQPLSGKAVILIHGIIRSSKAMTRMEEELARAGYLVLSFDYPSTRVPIQTSAAYLAKVVQALEGVEQIDFVVHSMGGLLVRSYLQQTADAPDPRLHRLVMLGTPNRGSPLANISQDNLLFRTVFGPAGQQLIEATDGLIASLPTPHLEFAVIAGGRGTEEGFNPLIPGDDDGVVPVQSALLPGAADSLRVPVWHSFLPSDPAVIAATRRFLEAGALRAGEDRQPVSKPPIAAPSGPTP
jgi:pimeloyl-ACP methyl ester carboxylesterase